MRPEVGKRTLQVRTPSQQQHLDGRWRGLLIGALALTSGGLSACQGNTGEDRADLNEILQDGELTAIKMSALSTGSAGKGAAGTTGAGGATGTAGMVGAPGSAGVGVADGGMPITGAAGTGGPFPTGTAGTRGGFDGGIPGRPFPQGAQGLWNFDDCVSFRTDLRDSTFSSHTAFRSVSAACAMVGVQGQGIAIDGEEDLVYVPDQPNFTFENGVTVAAWVKPTKLGGVRTIFRKREDGTSTFFLGENGKDYQFIIRLANGKAADVTAKAKLNVFTHVAGTYDGRELRLYLDGKLAARKAVNGRLSGGAGPLLMGNDINERRIDGVIDNVFFDTIPATPDEIVRLTCLPKPSVLTVTPTSSGLVAAGTPVTYEARLTNNSCEAQNVNLQASSQVGGFSIDPSFSFTFLDAGGTFTTPITVTSSPDQEPDDHVIQISAFTNFEFLTKNVTYSVQGTPCSVRSRKELEIRDLSVVEDPVRTAPGGAWTFGKLMEAMAPTPAEAPAMVEKLLGTWLTDQTVNGFIVPARTAMQDLVLGPFPRLPDGKLDLAHAPFRLLAIVNRIDLHEVAPGTAGEGRFVFGVLDQFGNPMQLTMILEYRIPAASAQEITNLADAWHALSGMTFPSPAYNAALQAITDRFAARNAAPGQPNGSAIGQVRTNDFFALGEWEFREFHLSASTRQLEPAGLALTPDRSFNNSEALSRFIDANEEAIISQTHTLPATFEGQPFQAGAMVTDFFVWNAPGVNPEARAKFALNTCNGCHTAPLESNVFVFQVAPRSLGQESQLSPFLQGTQVFDPFANVLRNFNELGRRGRILHDLVCPNDPLPPPPPETTPIGGDSDGGFAGTGGGHFDGGNNGGAGTGGGPIFTGSAGTGGKM